jgi:hypothetical protein
VVLFKCIVVLYNIICPNKHIVHRYEEGDGHVYHVVVLQVVQRGISPILIDILLSPVVISLEFPCPIDVIKVCAKICREPKEQGTLHKLCALPDWGVTCAVTPQELR